MTSNIVPSNFTDFSKEFKTDEDGKGFVSRRGLARMCGVKRQTWGRGGSKYTLVIDRHLTERGQLVAADTTDLISDIEASLIVKYYAYAGKVEAQKIDELLESPENPVASARGCRGGEMLIPSATRHEALASERWRMDEVANKFLASTKIIIAIFDIFM
jgi:hypothetical protein